MEGMSYHYSQRTRLSHPFFTKNILLIAVPLIMLSPLFKMVMEVVALGVEKRGKEAKLQRRKAERQDRQVRDEINLLEVQPRSTVSNIIDEPIQKPTLSIANS